MQRPDEPFMEERLEQLTAELRVLDKKYRRMQFGLLVGMICILTVGTVGWSSNARKVITAQELLIEDEGGNPRVSISHTDEEGSHISLISPYSDPITGKPVETRADIGINESNTGPYFRLTNIEGKTISFYFTNKGNPRVFVGTPRGLATMIGIDDNMVAGLLVHDQTGKQGASIGVHPSGTRWMNLMQKDKAIWGAP